MTESTRVQRIVEIIQRASDELEVFSARGEGDGNRVTNAAVARINGVVSREFGSEIVQCVLCGGNKQSVDFYLRDEGTIIELEYSLKNPYPCIEKDLFKAFLAKEAGVDVRRLLLVGDPGSRKRLQRSGATSNHAIRAKQARSRGRRDRA